MNKLLEFEGITEHNIESICRRFAIIKIQARFFDAKYLAQHFKSPEKYGVFARDPDAKDFLQSGLGRLAGDRMHLAFESRVNDKDSILPKPITALSSLPPPQPTHRPTPIER